MPLGFPGRKICILEDMIKIYPIEGLRRSLSMAWRHLLRRKSFSLINIMGLSTGIAACLLIYGYVHYQESFDNYHPGADRIARVTAVFHGQETDLAFATSNVPLAGALLRDCPLLKATTRIQPEEVTVTQGTALFKEKNFVFSEASVFSIFSFSFLEGKAAGVLSEPNSIVLTKSTARKYFGDGAAIGKTLLCNRHTYRVTAVIADRPPNSDLAIDALLWKNFQATTSWMDDDFEVYTYVLFRGKLPDKKALSQAMAELGFPLTIKAGSLERQRGFMPMRLRRVETGVEFDVFDGRAAVEDVVACFDGLEGTDLDPRFERSANFRWGGDEDQMLAGVCAAAALAKLVNGVVLGEWEAKLLSPEEAIALARETLQATLKPKSAPRRGTRPADIKRYLKPLLKQRSDLVVIDRMVLIRPVRHFLRGAFLDRTSDKYKFQILPYLKPLWSPSWRLDILDSIYGRGVWQPHFEPLLIDTLQHDIFTPLGKITTHDDLAGALPDELEFFTTRVCALVLIGERERAEDCVRDLENSEYARRCRDRITSARDLLARDIKEVCAEFHEREAKAVKAMKLQSIWEPSPFPVELPAAQRNSRTAEPLFVPEPWLPRPPGLWLDVPEVPGEVRFAKTWRHRRAGAHRNGRKDTSFRHGPGCACRPLRRAGRICIARFSP